MKKLAVFLGGNQGSGKTSSAEYIEKVLFDNGWFVKIARFSDAINELAAPIHQKLSEYSDAPKTKVLLQKIGDIGRELYDEKIWINMAVKNVEREAVQYSNLHNSGVPIKFCVIFEDVRKEKELELVAKYAQEGYETISFYFKASETIRATRLGMLFRPDTKHNTESELALFKDKFDYDINTEGEEEYKEKKLFSIFSEKGYLETPQDHLSSLVDQFNSNMEYWQKTFGFGANFQWSYNTEGRKILKVKDFAPVETLPEDMQMARLAEVQKTMEGLDGSQQFHTK